MAYSNSTCDCPICLEPLTTSEGIFELPCQSCDFNYCSRCVRDFVQASRDDFQIASDGSRQVKVQILCPQCRSKYHMDISKVNLLRQAHSLGHSLRDCDGRETDDSQLTASQLSLKRDLYSRSVRRKVQNSYNLYLKLMEGRTDLSEMAEAEQIFRRVFEGLSVNEDESSDEEDGVNDPYSDKPASPKQPHLKLDSTLFQGLQDLMGKDEKIFLTGLMTSGEVIKLVQAAMILNGILKLSMQPSSVFPRRSFENTMTPLDFKKQADLIDRTKKSFPLANHMPGYFILPTFSSRENFLSFENDKWNGAIVPPIRSARVFDKVYGESYDLPNADSPRPVILIKSVRGPAGRVGLRKGDVVTHVNEVEWTGTAQELADHIYGLHQQHPDDNVSITVNANPETATFLQVRRKMMEQTRIEVV